MTIIREKKMLPLRKFELDLILEPGEVENLEDIFDEIVTEENFMNFNLPAENYDE